MINLEAIEPILRGGIAIVFTFSFAIFIHELGHYMFAKLFGVYVETFSIGFGKKLWKRKWGETEYAISAIPFGGYVKLRGMHSKEMEKLIHGEDDTEAEKAEAATSTDETPATQEIAETSQKGIPLTPPDHTSSLSESVVDEMNALREKAWWQKMLIFSAGCINNFLTAVVVFFLMLTIGVHQAEPISTVIEEIRFADPAVVKLQPKDEIVAFAGKPVKDFEELFTAVEDFGKETTTSKTIPITVKRDSATITVDAPVHVEPEFPPAGEKIVKVAGVPYDAGTRAIQTVNGLIDKSSTTPVTVVTATDGKETEHKVLPIAAAGSYWPLVALDFRHPAYISMALPNLPAEKAGIKMGDSIVSINGQPIASAREASETIRALTGKKVPIEVSRKGKNGPEIFKTEVEVRPDPENPERGQIGIAFGSPRTRFYQEPPGKAIKTAFTQAIDMGRKYFDAVGTLLTMSFQSIRENVGGPIQIGTMSYKAANEDLVYYFSLFAFFNIILAITNLMPLPVLDGGHILFATIESIIRRPLPAKLMIFIYNVFIFLILGLAILITFNDVLMNWWRLR